MSKSPRLSDWIGPIKHTRSRCKNPPAISGIVPHWNRRRRPSRAGFNRCAIGSVAGPVAIAVEQKRGALIYALMHVEFLHLYPVNPVAVAKMREAFYPSGAKDDPLDADLLL